MPDHKIGTHKEWQAARDELAKLESQHAERNEEIKRKRLELPWVPVVKEYEFETEDGRKTLAELFDGRSQLLAYNIMFGPDYTIGAREKQISVTSRWLRWTREPSSPSAKLVQPGQAPMV